MSNVNNIVSDRATNIFKIIDKADSVIKDAVQVATQTNQDINELPPAPMAPEWASEYRVR